MVFNRVVSSYNKIKRRNKKNEQKNSYFSLGVLTIIVLVIISLTAPLLKSVYDFNPHSNFEIKRTEKWDYRTKFKILMIGLDRKDSDHIFVDALALLVVDPNREQVGIININPDILVTDPDGSPVSLRRGLIESEDKDIYYLKDLSESLLATKVDRYVAVDKKFFDQTSRYTKSIPISLLKEVNDTDVTRQNKDAHWSKNSDGLDNCCTYEFIQSDNEGRDDQLLRQLQVYRNYTQSIDKLKLLLGIRDFIEIVEKTVDTDLSRNEIIYLSNFLRTIPPATYKTVYTGSGILSEIGKSGVYNVYRVDDSQLDQANENILEEGNVVLEQAVVEVLNASGEAGLARAWSRWISNIGAELIHVANAPYTEDGLTVYIDGVENYPNTIEHFRKILGEDIKIIDREYEYRHIGKIVIVVGK